MASTAASNLAFFSEFQLPIFAKVPIRGYSHNFPTSLSFRCIQFDNLRNGLSTRSSFSYIPLKRDSGFLSKPTSLATSGMEVSITDPKDHAIALKNAKIVVESEDENRIQLRVDLTGDDTQKVFDRVLTNLALSAPPIPGFRRQKGGKTVNVPKSLLLDMLGKERVTKFVIQEILSSTMTDYAKKENIDVKDKKVNTTQTAEELKLLFTPGKEFGFNAILELESASEVENLAK